MPGKIIKVLVEPGEVRMCVCVCVCACVHVLTYLLTSLHVVPDRCTVPLHVQEVKSGAPLVVMEAMKMEHVLEAPFAGTVSEMFTAVDDFVADSDVVVMLE